MKKYFILSMISAFFFITLNVFAAEENEEARSIKQVRGDLYRAQIGNYFTMALVTDDGIIITDPVSVEFSTWLKNELTKRFHERQ